MIGSIRQRSSFAALAVAIFSVVGLVGCSSPSDSGPQTLTVWSPQEQWQKSADFLEENTAALAEKYPGVKVDFVQIPYAEYEARYQAAFSSGGQNAPDVFIGPVPYYAYLGVATEAPADLQKSWSANVVNSISAAFQVDGKWYGYPDSADLGMELYYNKAIFASAGLDPENPPTTFDELLDYAKKLTIVEDGKIAQNGISVRYDGSPTGIADKAIPYIHAFGGQLYAEDYSTAEGYLNGSGTVAGLKYLQNLVQGSEAVASLELGNPDNTFAQGLSAMTFREAWYAGYLDTNSPDLDYAVVPLPTGPGGYPKVSLLFNWAFMVYAKGPHQELAWDWLRVTFDDKTDLKIAEMEGYLPVLEANYADPYVADRVDYSAVQKQISEGPGPQYSSPMSVQINARIGEAIEAILQGSDVKKTVDAAVPEINEMLKKGN